MDFENDIRAAVATLQSGGVLLYPTDTIWGLGCDARNETAVEKIFLLKQRPPEKSLIVLLAEARDVLQYVAAPPPDVIAIVEAFEEPTTVIYDGALGLADNVIAADGSVAIRVTSDPFCKALIKRFRGPLVSTSANLSGAAGAAFFRQISPAIITGADYVVHHRQRDETPRSPSRIVRLDAEGGVTVVRR